MVMTLHRNRRAAEEVDAPILVADPPTEAPAPPERRYKMLTSRGVYYTWSPSDEMEVAYARELFNSRRRHAVMLAIDTMGGGSPGGEQIRDFNPKTDIYMQEQYAGG